MPNPHKMKNVQLFLSFLFLIFSFNLIAQVGINDDASDPDPSAMLDVKSTESGMLVPRMTGAQRTAIDPAATGLLVYQTDAPDGFYYYTGTSWIQLTSSPVKELADADLNTKVQVEENPNENHIRFDVNGTEAMVLDNTGKLGIATASPGAKLEIAKVATDEDEDALRIGVDGEHAANIKFFDDDNEANQHFKISYDPTKEKLNFTSSKAGILNLNGKARLAGSYNTPGDARKVYVSGKYAFVADGNQGLQIIDIYDPSNPSLTGSYGMPAEAEAEAISVSGKYAFLAIENEGIFIIDISNPANPTLSDDYGTFPQCHGVYISGKYAFLAASDFGLRILDISDPKNPSWIGTYDTPGIALKVKISGKYAFIADGNSGLQIINISNPANPVLTSTYNTPSSAVDVYISGKYAFIAVGNSGLKIIDISDPANPVLTSTYNTTPAGARSVYVSGKYAFVTTGDTGLQIIDISDPTNPILSSTYNTPGSAKGVYVSGKYAFVADGTSGLQIIDIFGLSTPTINTGNINTNNMTITENLDIRNNLYVGNALNIGPGGIHSDGPVAFGNMESLSITTKKVQAIDGDGLKLYDDGGIGLHIMNGGSIIQNTGKYLATDQIRAINSNGLKLYDDGDNGLFIKDGGNVGIKTSDPTVVLQVDGGSDVSLSGGGYFIINSEDASNMVMDNNEIMARNNGVASQLLLNKDGGTVSINGSSTSYNLFCNGEAAKPGGGSWTVSSDLQLKDLNGSFRRSTYALQQLNPVKYRYKSNNPLGLPSDQEYIGLIAQEVQAVIPEAVGMDNEGYLTLKNDPIIWTMLNAIKEQKKMIEDLEQKVEALEKLLN